MFVVADARDQEADGQAAGCVSNQSSGRQGLWAWYQCLAAVGLTTVALMFAVNTVSPDVCNEASRTRSIRLTIRSET